MKDFIIGVCVTAILIVIFSTSCFPEDMPPLGNVGKEYPGNSGMILPGKGSEPAEAIITELQKDTKHETKEEKESSYTEEESNKKNEESNKESEEHHEEAIREEQNSMSEMLVGILVGIVSILIGETSALLIAIVCKKIWGNNDGKQCKAQ